MTDYTSPPTENQIITTGATWLAYASQALALREDNHAAELPIANLVEIFINAAGSESTSTGKAYLTSAGMFLEYLDTDLAEHLPADWRPLAARGRDPLRPKATQWTFKGLAAVLALVLPGHIDNFAALCKAQGGAVQTINLRRRAVRTFLAVAYREGVLTDMQARRMGIKPYAKREKRNTQPTGRRLANDEVKALRLAVLEHACTPVKAIRDKAILDAMLFAGLRRDEVCHLTCECFKQDGGRWWIVLAGKGQKTRRVKIHDTLFTSLKTWVDYRGLSWGEDTTPIFANLNRGGRFTGNGNFNGSIIGRIVAEYGALAGLAPLTGDNCLSPHDLRRTCARNAFDHGATLPQVQALLGHASVATTMLYIGSALQDDNTAIDRLNYS